MIRFSGGIETAEPIEIEFFGSDLPRQTVRTLATDETISFAHYPNVSVNLGNISSPEDFDGLVGGIDFLAHYILAK